MTLIDEETKAELFTFLVVGHLLALVRSGGFLRTSHLIESSQLWLKSNGPTTVESESTLFVLQPATWGATSQRWSNSRLKRGMAIPKPVSYILRPRS